MPPDNTSQIQPPTIAPGDHVADTKQFRKDLDEVLTRLKNASGDLFNGSVQSFPVPRRSRERSLAITKIQEAIMWLGMDLKSINESDLGSAPNPYPQSYDPTSPVISPTSEGLKL